MSSTPGSVRLEELLDRRSRRLRTWVVGLSVGSSLGLAVFALTRFFPAQPYGLADDFRVFYSAARMLAAGHNPYRLGPLQAVEQTVAHYPSLQPALDRFPYLPITATILEPLTKLPFWAAYALFTVLGVGLLLFTLALLARDLGWSRTFVLGLTVLVSWIALLGFTAGQFDALMFAVVAGAMLLCWHDRPLAAGLVMGLIWVKPDLLWPAPIFMFLALFEKPRRAAWFAGGWILTSTLCLLASSRLLTSWGHALHSFASGVGGLQPDLAGLPGLLGAAPAGLHLGTGVLAPGSLAVMVAAVIAMGVFGAWMMLSADWSRVSPVGRISWGVGLPIAIWLVATPYAHPNDDLLLLPLFMLTVGRDARRVHGLGLALAILVTLWILLIWPAGVIPWALGLAVMALVGLGLWRRRTDIRLTGFGAGLCLLGLAMLPAVWPFHLLKVGLTPIAVLLLVVEGSRTCWMEVGGAGTGPAYFPDHLAESAAAHSPAGG